jgi:hypothetical protein
MPPAEASKASLQGLRLGRRARVCYSPGLPVKVYERSYLRARAKTPVPAPQPHEGGIVVDPDDDETVEDRPA